MASKSSSQQLRGPLHFQLHPKRGKQSLNFRKNITEAMENRN
jgi:hypothetical protein